MYQFIDVLGAVFALYLLTAMKRRNLFLAGSYFSAISLFTGAVFLSIDDPIVTIIFVLLFAFSFASTLYPTLLAHVVETNSDITLGLALTMFSLMNIGTSYSLVPLLSVIKIGTILFLYSIFAAGCMIYVFFVTKESKGLTDQVCK